MLGMFIGEKLDNAQGIANYHITLSVFKPGVAGTLGFFKTFLSVNAYMPVCACVCVCTP